MRADNLQRVLFVVGSCHLPARQVIGRLPGGSDWIGRFEKPSSGIKAQTSRHREGTGGSRLQALEKTRLTQLNASIENFLAALQQSAKTLEIVERQKIVRLVIKQIIVNGDTLTIHHSIPISRGSQQSQLSTSYLLCTRSPFAVAG